MADSGERLGEKRADGGWGQGKAGQIVSGGKIIGGR